jgi:hypothetical protein
MKNKTSILVGTRHFFYALLVAVIFCGCGNENTNEPKKQKEDMFEFGMKTIEHDSCEYVVFKDNGRSSVAMLHKQNCKFCAERSKK